MGGVRAGRGGSFEDCARSRRAWIVAALNRNSSVVTSTMLVTGGAGFIGCAAAHTIVAETGAGRAPRDGR
jgi:NADPH-dependent 2,4-dienoyl-CoA reductase/sulfur reductase-like enzyme